jgi:hypothetical protein
VRFKTGAKISGAPTGRRKKLIFGGGALPAAKNQLKKGIYLMVVLLLPQS